MSPIRPENRKRYPLNWKTEIRPKILARAGNRCEGSPAFPDCRAANYEPHPVTGSRVILTIAHVSEVVEDCSDSNLLALCQRCHNTMDAAMRRRNRDRREAHEAVHGKPTRERFAHRPQRTRRAIVDGQEVVEVELTQGKVALVDVADQERVVRHRWYAARHSSGYYHAKTTLRGSRGQEKVSLHCFLTGCSNVDHANRNPLDCRRENLRPCDAAQNQLNTVGRGGASRFKGVSWDKRKQKWRVAFRALGAFHWVGNFDDEDAAAEAYDRRVRRLGSEFARLNFVWTKPVPIWPESGQQTEPESAIPD